MEHKNLSEVETALNKPSFFNRLIDHEAGVINRIKDGKATFQDDAEVAVAAGAALLAAAYAKPLAAQALKLATTGQGESIAEGAAASNFEHALPDIGDIARPGWSIRSLWSKGDAPIGGLRTTPISQEVRDFLAEDFPAPITSRTEPRLTAEEIRKFLAESDTVPASAAPLKTAPLTAQEIRDFLSTEY
ncbi:MAG TPA: hypothetical protein V6C97_15440 [Oculatellaceae cyanobacterium]